MPPSSTAAAGYWLCILTCGPCEPLSGPFRDWLRSKEPSSFNYSTLGAITALFVSPFAFFVLLVAQNVVFISTGAVTVIGPVTAEGINFGMLWVSVRA